MTGNSKPSNGHLSDEFYRFLVCVRHRREKKKRRSRDRLRKKRRHRSRSRSASESSRSRSRSRSESRVSPITSAVRKLAAGNVTKQLLLQPFVYLFSISISRSFQKRLRDVKSTSVAVADSPAGFRKNCRSTITIQLLRILSRH